jgi:hypothetical protein
VAAPVVGRNLCEFFGSPYSLGGLEPRGCSCLTTTSLSEILLPTFLFSDWPLSLSVLSLDPILSPLLPSFVTSVLKMETECFSETLVSA